MSSKNPQCQKNTVILIYLFVFLFNVTSLAQAYQFVKTSGRQLVTDFDQDGIYTPFLIKGVTYSPTPIGRYPSDWGYPDANDPRPENIFDDPNILNRDFQLLSAMNVNTIRIYKGNNTKVTLADVNDPLSIWYHRYDSIGRNTSFVTKQTLDSALQNGISVIAGFWMDREGYWACEAQGSVFHREIDYTNTQIRQRIKNKFAEFVTAVKDHPAILFWAIGNENNFSLSDDIHKKAFYSLVNEMAAQAHTIEGANAHPVALVNGEIGNINNTSFGTTDAQMNALDIWGANIYRGESFGSLFSEYKLKSQKPFWISEFGIDAWQTTDVTHPEKGAENQLLQANWDTKLWKEIVRNREISVGATIFDYADQWWKPYEFLCGDQSLQCNSSHDYLGFGPTDTSCPVDGKPDMIPSVPDKYFNEEWFGVVGISKSPVNFQADIINPRLVYSYLQRNFAMLTGKVLDQATLLPISLAKVRLYGKRQSDGKTILMEVLTNASGEFIFYNVTEPLTTYKLTASSDTKGTWYSFRSVYIDTVFNSVVMKGRATTSYKPPVIGRGTLSGFVFVQGSPVLEAELLLDQASSNSGDLRGYTDAEGFFIFENLPKGTYSMRVRKSGYLFPTQYQINVTDNNTVNLMINAL